MEKDPGLHRMEESFVQLESKTSKRADAHRAHAARRKKKLPNKGEMKSEPNLGSREAVVSPPSLSASDGSKNSDTQAQQPPQGSLQSSEEVGKTWSFRLTTSRLGDMVAVMKDPTRGIRLQEVTYKWKHYPYCFSGKAFVDWVMDSVRGWESREEAVKLGELLMAKGIFKGINSRATSSTAIIDDPTCYYTFQVDDFIAQLNNKMMQEVVGKMRHEKYGICVKDRKYLLQSYPNSFVGSEAVDWMVENIFIKTRREAVELGQILMNNGYIYHATHKLPFCDGNQFYCFEQEKKTFKRGYLSIKEESPLVPHAYSHLIRSADFNNYPKMQDKEPEDGDTEKAIVEEEEEGGKGGRKGLSKSDGATRRALVSEKLHSPSFKLFWCCIKGEHLWCFISPRSPHPHTSIRLSSGIALKVVHRHCDKTDASLSDKCRFEILTCYEGRQYLLIPKTCKKMTKWAAVLYDYSVQGENDLMEEAEQGIERAMLEKHRLWLQMRHFEKRTAPLAVPGSRTTQAPAVGSLRASSLDEHANGRRMEDEKKEGEQRQRQPLPASSLNDAG